MQRAIIIVTGSNGGLGFGICLRLLNELSQLSPYDCLSQAEVDPNYSTAPKSKIGASSPWDSLTLIMACRSERRALDARQKLLKLFDTELEKRKKSGATAEEVAFADRFRKSLVIDFVPCDLASIDSTFAVCETIKQRYPYITHIVCNAGTGAFTGLNWTRAITQCIIHPVKAVTYPDYKLQEKGVLSQDKLGWVWQCNLFGHYLMVRNLRPLLNATPTAPARVLWTSSLDPLPQSFNPADPQLRDSSTSYEHSKYETQLVATRLNSAYRQPGNDASGTAINQNIRHFVCHPGITATNIFAAHLGWLLDYAMLLAFYFARLLGSVHHPISLLNGAHSASHAALAPVEVLPPVSAAVQYGSRANMFGKSRVAAEKIVRYDEKIADDLIAISDSLCEEFEQALGRNVET